MKLKKINDSNANNTNNTREDQYISDMGFVKDKVSNKHGVSIDKASRPLDYFNCFEHSIEIGDLQLEISGIGREETIKAFKRGIPLVDNNLLTMNGTISNEEFDNYLKSKTTPNHTTKSIFLHSKNEQNEKNGNEVTIEKKFLDSAFNEDTITKLKAGESVIIPIRQNSNYGERAGHWLNLRLTLKNGELHSVLENTTAESSARRLAETKENHMTSIVRPIASFLQNEKGVDFSAIMPMDFVETKQYGNMGCGITTAKNILSGRSSNPSNYLQDHDQEIIVEEAENWEKDLGFPTNTRYFLNESGKQKSLSGDLVSEALMRLDIKHTLEYGDSYKAPYKTTDNSPPTLFLETDMQSYSKDTMNLNFPKFC